MQNEQLYHRRNAKGSNSPARRARRGEHVRVVNPSTGQEEVTYRNDVPQALSLKTFGVSNTSTRAWQERISRRLVHGYAHGTHVGPLYDADPLSLARWYYNGLKLLDAVVNGSSL